MRLPVEASDTVRALLRIACTDCHSNFTRYPWYSYIQPFAWLQESHVRHGKAELNLSEFESYTRRRQLSKLRMMESSVRDGTMPLKSYIMLHNEARLTLEQKGILMDWLDKAGNQLRNNE